MQEIIKLVMQKLATRQYSALVLSAGKPFDNFARDKGDFVKNSTIVLKDISPVYLKKLAAQDASDEWVKWSLEAFTYGCKLVLVLNGGSECFIPEDLLLKWPLKIRRNDEKQYVMLEGSVITYAKVMEAPSNSILILKEKQRMTALAEEALTKKNILLLGRR